MVILKQGLICFKEISQTKFSLCIKISIEKLFYLDTWEKNKNDLKPTEVIFKYKFDKQKNWTEVIKNVNGKDKYKWVREIEYYK